MPEHIDDLIPQLINDVDSNKDDLDKTAIAVKNLKTFGEARNLIVPEIPEDPEPTGTKAFFVRHAGDLIKVGGSLLVVGVIAVIEAKGDVIFRSKASKFI